MPFFTDTEPVIIGDPFTFEELFDPEFKPRLLKTYWIGGMVKKFITSSMMSQIFKRLENTVSSSKVH